MQRLDDAERERLLDVLRNGLDHQKGRVRIHAAEALLWHGYADEVTAALAGEADSAPPEVRIEVWQILAQAAPTPQQREAFIERIRGVLREPDAPDREHARESLEKLRGDPPSPERQAAERLAASADPAAALRELAIRGSTGDRHAAAMALAERGTTADRALLRDLLEDADADVRIAAAHALLRIDRRIPHRMTALDWSMIGAYMLGMLLVGWYYSRRVTTTDDYMLGGRNMRSWAVGLSLFATLLSTISYLSWPGEMIKNGPMFLSSLLAYPLIGLVVGWALIPYFMKLNVTSAYEILETRLGPGVRLLGSVFFLSLRLMWMAVIIYATTSKVLVPLMGLEPSAAPWLAAVLGAVTIVYTSLGGLRAVVFTDVAQTAILFGGAILAMIVITSAMGGVSGWWPTEWAPNWQEPKFGYDPTARITFLGAIVATFTWHVCTAGSDQMAVQRYLATKDVSSARRMFTISLLAGGTVQLFLSLLGFALLAYFQSHRHILADGQTIASNADQLFPQFIVYGLPSGVSGLVVAGLLAAAMSSLSSGLNSSCSVVTTDFIDRYRRHRETDLDHVRLARYISVLIGVAVVLLSSLVGVVQGNLLEIAYKVVNLLVAPLFGLFFMAMFVRWATSFGTIVGAVAGLTVVTAVNYWVEITGTTGISFLWAMPLSFLVQTGVGMLASLLPIGRRARPEAGG